MSRHTPLPLLFVCAFALVGCELFLATPKPIPSVRRSTTRAPVRERTLLILLPGRGSRMGDYVKGGFFRLAQDARLPLDVVAVDAHFGYYMRRKLLPRIHEDFVLPARKKGYRQVWILGISMGGLGALLYAQKHPRQVDGLILLAPYLGDKKLIRRIEEAGGVGAWKPTEPVKESDYQRRLWRWLKAYVKPSPGLPRLFIGWGRSDRFRRANALLATLVPTPQTFGVDGGHTYGPWRQLFKAILASAPFRQRVLPPPPPPTRPATKKRKPPLPRSRRRP